MDTIRRCAKCGVEVTDQRTRVVDQVDLGRGYLEPIIVAVENLPCGDEWRCAPDDTARALA